MTEVFEYALIRVVPRVERGEAINVGVIVYSQAYRYLCARIELDGPLEEVETRRKSQRACVLRRRLAMSSERGRTVAGRPGVVECRGSVSGAFGVGRQPLEVRRAGGRLGQRCERRPVQGKSARRRQ